MTTWIPYLYLVLLGVWLLVWVWRDLPRGRGRVAALAVRLGLRGDQ